MSGKIGGILGSEIAVIISINESHMKYMENIIKTYPQKIDTYERIPIKNGNLLLRLFIIFIPIFVL
jgi:hypothetical protein